MTLGYVDDDYNDEGGNGYWGHDDGNDNQCANTDPGAPLGLYGGPAWVNVHTLWPPDGRLLTVGTEDGEDASPGSGVDPASFTVQVTSNETATGPEPDYVITGRTVQLRVARADNGLGRVYTITGSVSDVAGNFGDVGSVVQSPC